MKITNQINFDISDDISEDFKTFEKFKSRKRKLSSIKKLNKLFADEDSTDTFNNNYLEDLKGRGLLDELVCIIKSGKEASVYLGRSENIYTAVKIYMDLRVRSFRKDDVYRDGRFIGDVRLQKAIDQGSKTGLDAHQILWVGEEFRQMKSLFEKGVPVPRPIAQSGLVIVMEFIGEDGIAAPRISDLDLEKDEAEEAFSQSLKILKQILSLGRIHGDFSAFNILWNKGKAVVIDFPQVMGIKQNIMAKDILLRDINSFCKSFKRFKIEIDQEKIYRDMMKIIKQFDWN